MNQKELGWQREYRKTHMQEILQDVFFYSDLYEKQLDQMVLPHCYNSIQNPFSSLLTTATNLVFVHQPKTKGPLWRCQYTGQFKLSNGRQMVIAKVCVAQFSLPCDMQTNDFLGHQLYSHRWLCEHSGSLSDGRRWWAFFILLGGSFLPELFTENLCSM